MNERIKELEAQCWESRSHPNAQAAMGDRFNTEKFAELIVTAVLDEVSERAYYSGDRAWSDSLDRRWVELEFGIGELAELKK